MRLVSGVWARIDKLEENRARNFSETVKLQERVNYLRKVLEDLLMEAEEEENCDGMTSRKANFGSTDIRFRKKNMEPAAPKKNTS